METSGGKNRSDLIILVVVVLAIALLVKTNPSKEDHSKWLDQEAKAAQVDFAKKHPTLVNPPPSVMANVPLEMRSAPELIYHNYYLFSMTEWKWTGGRTEKATWGILNKVYPRKQQPAVMLGK
jgi:hypothetical protein